MPRVYIRKANARARARWTEEQLKEAISKLRNKEMGLNAVSKEYCIEKKTVLRRYRSNTDNLENINKWKLLEEVKQEKVEKALRNNIKRQSGLQSAKIRTMKSETKKVKSKIISTNGETSKGKFWTRIFKKIWNFVNMYGIPSWLQRNFCCSGSFLASRAAIRPGFPGCPLF